MEMFICSSFWNYTQSVPWNFFFPLDWSCFIWEKKRRTRKKMLLACHVSFSLPLQEKKREKYGVSLFYPLTLLPLHWWNSEWNRENDVGDDDERDRSFLLTCLFSSKWKLIEWATLRKDLNQFLKRRLRNRTVSMPEDRLGLLEEMAKVMIDK